MPHIQAHRLNSESDHLGGTQAQPGKINFIGTDDRGFLIEKALEVENTLLPAAGEVPRRGTGGHLLGPTGEAQGQQYVTADQAQTLATGGPWRGVIVGDYPDHDSPAVTDLSSGDIVLNSTNNKLYVVDKTTGGNTGNTVTWVKPEGELPTTNVIYLNLLRQAEFFYEVSTDVWHNLGSSGHNQKHMIDSTLDHGTNSNRTGVVYTSNQNVHVLLTMEESSGQVTVLPGSPLISTASGEPAWGKLRLAPDKINAAGSDPAYTDLNSVQAQTLAIVETASTVFLAYKRNNTNTVFVEMTA